MTPQLDPWYDSAFCPRCGYLDCFCGYRLDCLLPLLLLAGCSRSDWLFDLGATGIVGALVALFTWAFFRDMRTAARNAVKWERYAADPDNATNRGFASMRATFWELEVPTRYRNRYLNEARARAAKETL